MVGWLVCKRVCSRRDLEPQLRVGELEMTVCVSVECELLVVTMSERRALRFMFGNSSF